MEVHCAGGLSNRFNMRWWSDEGLGFLQILNWLRYWAPALRRLGLACDKVGGGQPGGRHANVSTAIGSSHRKIGLLFSVVYGHIKVGGRHYVPINFLRLSAGGLTVD